MKKSDLRISGNDIGKPKNQNRKLTNSNTAQMYAYKEYQPC